MRPYLEKTFTKTAGGVARGIDPEFKLQYHKEKKIVDSFPFKCLV
jgi:hypothetical protein